MTFRISFYFDSRYLSWKPNYWRPVVFSHVLKPQHTDYLAFESQRDWTLSVGCFTVDIRTKR